MEGPYEGESLGQSTKWTDPTRIQYLTSPQSGRAHLGLKFRQVHKVDGPYEGKSLGQSAKWTDPTRI